MTENSKLKNKDIKKKISHLFQVCENAKKNSETELFLEKSKEIVKLARTIDDSENEIKANFMIAISLFYLQRYADCIDKLKAFIQSIKTNNEYYMRSIRTLGHCYWHTNQIDKAEKFFINSLKWNQENKNEDEIAKDNTNLGAFYQHLGDYQKSIQFNEKSLEYFLKKENRQGIGFAFSNISGTYFQMGKYQNSLEYIHNAIPIAEEINDQAFLARSINIAAVCYLKLGMFDRAIEFLHRTLKIREEIGFDISAVLLNLGATYNDWGNSKKALQYYNQAIELAEKKNDKALIAKILNNIANIYYSDGKLQIALDNFQKTLQIKLELSDVKDEVIILSNIGSVYSDLKKYDKAIGILKEAMIKAEDLEIYDSMFTISNKLAEIYFHQGDISQAEENINKSSDLSEKTGAFSSKLDLLELKIQLLKHKKQFEEALKIQEEYIELKQKIFNENQQKRISEMQVQFDTEKKEKEAEFFKQKSIELEKKNSLIEKQKNVLEETIKKLHKSEIRYDAIESDLQKNIGLELIGESESIKNIRKLIAVVSKADNTNVLITGENGTGKEIIARHIHTYSKRKKNSFYAVNSSAIPETLFESEFFGYEKNAFTGATKAHVGWFEIADGGTLFLDEIGTMQHDRQIKLLRVLEERKVVRLGSHKAFPVNVRVICATNSNLFERVQKGEFREDLYHRLSTVVINIPPLRERKDDIPLLLEHFVRIFSVLLNKPIKRIDSSIIPVLMKLKFSGNVRELRNIVERAVIFSDSSTLKLDHFAITDRSNITHENENFLSLELLEKEHIIKALKMTKFRQVNAAELLGIDRRVIARRIKKYNIKISK